MRFKFFSIVSFTFLIICNNLKAQIPLAPTNVQSPNAASLGQFGKIPVSHFTGTPNIEVPLYTIQQGEISVPLTLRYHASGVRPDQHPGWVGMGFALSSGGVISRVVHDAPDDYNNPNYAYGQGLGYYYQRTLLNLGSSGWTTGTNLFQSVHNPDIAIKDSEPDEFNFNFNGYSGSFYLMPDGTWKVKCDQPIQVQLIPNQEFLPINIPAPAGIYTNMTVKGTSPSFAGFIITTEDGTKYKFGGVDNAIEYSIGFFTQNIEEWCAGSWYLTDITTINGNNINFLYERDNFINQLYFSFSLSNSSTVRSAGTSILNPQCGSNSSSYLYLSEGVGGKLVCPVYLSQINSIHTKIKFERSSTNELRYEDYLYDSHTGGPVYGDPNCFPLLMNGWEDRYYQSLNNLQWKQLDLIRIENTNGTLYKAYQFNYSNDVNKRLRLESIQEKDKNLAELPPYIFNYNEGELPIYLSNKVDHWGFYNNVFAYIHPTLYYSYRQPVKEKLFYGILNKITYPTGGVTEFTYEPHYYNKRVHENRSYGLDNNYNTTTMAGGLRIKKIVSYDPKSPLSRVEKSYYYVNNYTLSNSTSSGILNSQIKYNFSNYSRSVYPGSLTNTVSIFSSQSVLPGSTNDMGAHVTYSNVIEVLADGSYTNYNFSNYDNGYLDEPALGSINLSHTPYLPYNNTDAYRGKLLSETQYNKQGLKVRQRNITYEALNKATEFVPTMNLNSQIVCTDAYSVVEGTAYKIYTFSFLPTSESTLEFDNLGNTIFQVSKNMTYNNTYKLLTEESIQDSKNQAIRTVYKYPIDYLSEPSTDVRRKMAEKHIFGAPLEQKKYLNNSQVAAKTTTYGIVGSNIFVPIAITSQTNTSSSIETLAMADYDSKGNVISVKKNSFSTSTCYVWGYKGQFPIAKIDNAEYNLIVTSLGGQTLIDNFYDKLNPTKAEITAFLAPLYTIPNALVNTYVFDPLTGLLCSTDARNKATYYEYDATQKLRGIKDFEENIIKSFEYKLR